MRIPVFWGVSTLLILVTLSGCFLMEGRVKLGGLVSYVADIDISGKIAIENQPSTKKEIKKDENEQMDYIVGANYNWGYL